MIYVLGFTPELEPYCLSGLSGDRVLADATCKGEIRFIYESTAEAVKGLDELKQYAYQGYAGLLKRELIKNGAIVENDKS
jgi:hypothetical protein